MDNMIPSRLVNMKRVLDRQRTQGGFHISIDKFIHLDLVTLNGAARKSVLRAIGWLGYALNM